MRQPLTTGEATMVALATVRESFSHRRWPPEVVTAFARAEIIRGVAEASAADRGITISELLQSGLARALHSLRAGDSSVAGW